MRPKRNVTITLDEHLLKKAKIRAVEADFSLSEWIANVLAEAITGEDALQKRRKQALKLLDNPHALGGKALTRNETHDR